MRRRFQRRSTIQKDIDVVIRYHVFPSNKNSDGDESSTALPSQDDIDYSNTGASEAATAEGNQNNHVLTTSNCTELATAMNEADPASPSMKAFSEKYKGRTIEFDGNVAVLSPHCTDASRFDMLILWRGFRRQFLQGPNPRIARIGPENIKAKDGYSHLPSLFPIGSNVHSKAEIEDYSDTRESAFLTNPTVSDRA